jgi:23S rRNA (cytidine1920-2'-O)/16S rRNA (cytidine1409-2'-O)-methyltransferase
LVEAGLFESRAKAQEAIAAGLVLVDGTVVDKASLRVSSGALLEAQRPYPWVSRGGVKLAAALDWFGIDPAGQVCLDVGASTGGFTDVLLARGARHVYAVDVGRDQLHARLRSDSRVTDWSGTDARSLALERFAERPEMATFDVSFISLSLVLPPTLALLASQAHMACLIKPQFEVGPGRTSKGVVREPALREEVCRNVVGLLETLGWTVIGLEVSPIAGGDGNVEFLAGARRG